MEVNEKLMQAYRDTVKEFTPLLLGIDMHKSPLAQTPIFEMLKTINGINMLREYLDIIEAEEIVNNITNECPTLDNKINCSVCTHECKLRMQLEQSKVDTSPEYPPAVIYY